MSEYERSWPCHKKPQTQWCDRHGPGGFMGHACAPLEKLGDDNLELLIEEAAEVIQAATKIMRFGIDARHPTYYSGAPNRWMLTEEVGQLLHCIERLSLDQDHLKSAAQNKKESLKYLGQAEHIFRKRPASPSLLPALVAYFG